MILESLRSFENLEIIVSNNVTYRYWNSMERRSKLLFALCEPTMLTLLTRRHETRLMREKCVGIKLDKLMECVL